MARLVVLKHIFIYIIGVLFLMFAEVSCSCSPKESNDEPIKKKPPQKKIFILNGLWQHVRAFDSTVGKLSQSFQSQGMEVIVGTLEEPLTSRHTIIEQALIAFDKLRMDLRDDPTCQVILVGHSQGGVRAAKILVLNEKAGRPLNIKGLVTLGTPWQGAPLAAITIKSIEKNIYRPPFKYILNTLQYTFPGVAQLTSRTFLDLFFNECFPMENPGVKDLVPKSTFLVSLALDMESLSHIPVLAIAGSNGNIAKFLKNAPLPPEPFTTYFRYARKMPDAILNKGYASIVAGKYQSKSDLVVPLSSQLGEKIACPFERYTIPDAIHDAIPFMNLPVDLLVYNHPEALEQIISFSKSNFS